MVSTTTMKKPRKTRLVVEREVLRVLQARELARIDAGNGIAESNACTTRQQLTTDSVKICCA
jgi:hypothetical protein